MISMKVLGHRAVSEFVEKDVQIDMIHRCVEKIKKTIV